MTVTQLTWDAVVVTPHATADPTASYAYTYPDPYQQDVASITTGNVSASYTVPFLLPTHAPIVGTPTHGDQQTGPTEGIIFPNGVPVFCS